MKGGAGRVADRIRENKIAREKAVKFRQDKANLSCAPVGLYDPDGKLGFMSPCKGEVSQLTIKAEPESVVNLTGIGLSLIFDIPEDGIYEDSGTFIMDRRDSVSAKVTKKDAPTEAFLSFLFKPLGKAASLVHFDPEVNEMVTTEPGEQKNA